MKSSGIGGQAVIEGVMMKNKDEYAVAVRKPNHEIEVHISEYNSIIPWKPITRIPIVRGVFNFIDSMVIGMKTLTYSASFYEEEGEQPSKVDKAMEKVFKEKTEKVIMGATITFSIVMAVAIFMVLPYFLSNLLREFIISNMVLAITEGVIRILIFISYILLISRMKDIQRVFMYHGAEHKCINCIEHGLELTVENVKKSSKQHKRCGTSFMLFVMVVSVILFIFIQVESPVLRVVYRILLVPLIAGISYELIKLAGRTENVIVNILSKPGMWLQNLTTLEPEDDMIEVAIASVEAVFDWKKYLDKNFTKESMKKSEQELQEMEAIIGDSGIEHILDERETDEILEELEIDMAEDILNN